MIVNMMTIEWNTRGEQIRRAVYKIRAHKKPVMPDRFEAIRDDTWQEQYRGKAMFRLTTWTVTQA